MVTILKFKKEYKLNFGVYFTPADNLCYTAMTEFRNKYKDHPYIKKMINNISEMGLNTIILQVRSLVDLMRN